MLEHFSWNVERKVCTVNNSLYKTEVLGQKLFAVIHNKHTAWIKLKSLFVFLCVVVIRSNRRNKEQCLVGYNTFNRSYDSFKWLVHSHKFFAVELVIFFLSNIFLSSLPKRNHAVECYGFRIILIFGLVAVLGFFLNSALCHIHNNRVADVVGILLDKSLYSVLFKKFVIVFIVCVILDFKNNLCAGIFLFNLADCVAVCTAWLPAICRILTIFLCVYGNLLCNHKCRVETNAELTDNVNVVLLFFHALLEFEWAWGCDCAEVVFKVILVHADTVIRDCKSTVFFVGL